MWGRGSWVKVAPKGSYIFHLWKSIGTHTKYGPISDTRSTKKLIPNVIIVPIFETRQLGPTNNNSTSRELHGWLWQQTRGCNPFEGSCRFSRTVKYANAFSEHGIYLNSRLCSGAVLRRFAITISSPRMERINHLKIVRSLLYPSRHFV